MFKAELSLDFSHNFAAKLNHGGNEEVLVGYICFWVIEGEAHLLNIAVKPDYRRMGLGKHLMRVSKNGLPKRGIEAPLLRR